MEPVQELDPKEEALANLLAEVDAASEVVLGKRDVLGRVPGFYAGLASGKGELTSHLQKQYYPGRGGKRRKYTRKQRGGAACDSWIVSLAVDSAIILAGAAAFAGTSYGGFKTLSYYMSTYGLPDAIVEIITAFYETLKTLLTDSVPAVASGVGSAATGVFSGFTSLFNAASTVTKPGLPAVGVYRYFFQQGTSAREDAALIAERVSDTIQNTKTFVEGVVTRSRAKKEALQASIAQTNQNVRAALTNARDAASTQAFRTMHKVSNLKDFICGLIDGLVNKTVTTANALLRITQFFADLRLQDDERVQPPVGAAAGAAAAFDAEVLPGPDSPRPGSPILPGSPRSDSSRPGSPILPDSPRSDSPRLGSPIPPDSPRPGSPRSDDDEDLAASEQLRGIFQGGKRHRKRTMHQRSKKHHKGKKSRKHIHRRR